MRIISTAMLREFWTVEPAAETPLKAWRKTVMKENWINWSDLKQTCGSADLVGSCVVFNVGNNRWRLIARINFQKRIVYALKIMRHSEYDRKDPRNKSRSAWEEECGCHKPPPKR